MKKKILIIFSTFFLLNIVHVSADNSPKVFLFDKRVDMDNPVIINGNTLVPLRALFEALGANVTWDDKNNTVLAKKDDTELSIQIGNNKVLKNGHTITIEESARIINDQTYVPLRFVAESFNQTVDWDNGNHSIYIGKSVGTPTYQLELDRWSIYNDGTHPIETTKGFNDALIWAHEQGYTAFKVPSGNYLIAKGDIPNDPNAQINMVSDMMFWLDDNAVIEKETNGFEQNHTLYVGPDVKNTIIKGGTYKGDRYAHDYSKKDNANSPGTHESGHGITIEGSNNIVIDGVKTMEFIGDGIDIGGANVGINGYYGVSFQSGSIDGNGGFVTDKTKIRSKTKFDFTHPIFQKRHTFTFNQAQNLNSNFYDAYFYKADGTFLTSLKNLKMGQLVQIPDGADYYYPVFSAASTSGVFMTYWSNQVAKNIVVKNSETAFNRRQGITIGGGDDVIVDNNKIHDISGTAPQYGIDSEGMGFYPNSNLTIKNNHFYNNKGGDIVFADGEHAIIDRNLFDSPGVGFYIWAAFSDSIITNNTFNKNGLTLGGTARADHNTFNDSTIYLKGKEVSFDNATLTDSIIKIDSDTAFGVKASNITITNSGSTFTSLTIGEQPVHLTNVSIKGKTKLWTIAGKGSDASIYDNLTLEDYNNHNGTNLPAGTYNNCSFISNTVEANPLVINQAGKYVFNNCSFKNINKALSINSMYGEPDITINKSTFVLSGSDASAILIAGAKGFSLTDSTFSAINLAENPNSTMIKIGVIGGSTKPTKVLGATIKGNVITTNVALKGIDTIDGGTDAPAYDIESNILYNAKLKLNPADINVNNQEISK